MNNDYLTGLLRVDVKLATLLEQVIYSRQVANQIYGPSVYIPAKKR